MAGAQPLQGDGLPPAATGRSPRVGQRCEFLPGTGSESRGGSWAGVPREARWMPTWKWEGKAPDPRMPRVCGPNGKWPVGGDTSPAFKEAHSEAPSGWRCQEPHTRVHKHTHTHAYRHRDTQTHTDTHTETHRHAHTNNKRNPLQTPPTPESTMPHPNSAGHARLSCPLTSSRPGGGWGG